MGRSFWRRYSPDVTRGAAIHLILTIACAQRHIPNSDGDSLLLTDKHNQLLAAGDAGIEEISLQHGVMLGHDWNHNGRIF